MAENTLLQLITEATRTLSGRSDSPRLDAEVLLCHALGKPRVHLRAHGDSNAPTEALAVFRVLLARRLSGEPVAYLTGEREFWSQALIVRPGVLIPRPDTETLVHAALEVCDAESAIVADLGTGTGAVAIALTTEEDSWHVVATERDLVAYGVARENITRLGLSDRVELRKADLGWFDALAEERFDLIVSNPPYVVEDDPHLAEGDLQFEPRTALAAGPDGLDDIRIIVKGAARHLLPGGWLLLEHGFEQGEAVAELLGNAGYTDVSQWRDLAGRPRVCGGRISA